MSRRPTLLASAVVAALLVAGARLAAHAEREASFLSSWHLWSETDEWAAVATAKRISAGNVLDVPAWRPYFSWQKRFGTAESWDAAMPRNVYYQGPAYPYLLAFAGVPSRSGILAVRLGQLLLAVVASGVLAAAAAAVLLRAGRSASLAAGAGVLAGVAYGLFGPLVFLDGFLYRDGPVAHASALLLALPLLAEKPPGALRAAGLGLLCGAAALLKQTALPLGLLAGAVALSRTKAGRARFEGAAGLTAGLLLALSPLLARNAVVGAPLLAFDTRPLVGVPWANARGADGSGSASPLLLAVLKEAKGSTLKAAALTAATWREEPFGLVALELRKLASAFNRREIADNASFDYFRDRLSSFRYLPLFPWLLGPGLVGLFLAARHRLFRRGEALLAAGATLVPIGACVLVSTTTRYRSGIVAPLALGTALAAVFVLEALRERRLRFAGWAVGTSLLLTAASFLPSPVPVRRVRWADAVVGATLAEARISPGAGAAEIRRYLADAGEDTDRVRGLKAMERWLDGEREWTLVEPEGVAPPERRYRLPGR